MQHYWITFCNDGVELFGTHCKTKAEAIKELKNAFVFDLGESENAAEYNDYYIEEYWETDDAYIVGQRTYYTMSVGPRGGVTAKVKYTL